MRRLVVAVGLLVAVVVLAPRLVPDADTPAAGPGAGPAGTKRGGVTRVVDGDTLHVRTAAGDQVVRLLGIDTPEVYPRVECGGPAASAALRALLPPGTEVELTPDPSQADRDRYGRLLRYVDASGRDIERELLADGRARVYVFQGRPFARVDAYRAAESAARSAPRGIWRTC